MDLNKKFIKYVQDIVYKVLDKEGVLKKDWHYGIVESVISDNYLNIYVDDSTISQKISCNPNITFNTGDKVYVIFINGDSKDKFVLCKIN